MSVRSFGTVLLVLGLSGCGVGEGDGSRAPWENPPTPVADALDPLPGIDEVEPIDPYSVKLETTRGEIIIEVDPESAPRGAARFKKLVVAGFYDGNRFFRVVPDFVVQFGMNGDPTINAQWSERKIPDDPVLRSNERGTVTFATAGTNGRTTQIFINLKDNPDLDHRPESFAPFGRVVAGLDVVDSINPEHGQEPDQMQIREQGNEYLDEKFPGLDSIIKATLVEPPPAADADGANSDEAASNE